MFGQNRTYYFYALKHQSLILLGFMGFSLLFSTALFAKPGYYEGHIEASGKFGSERDIGRFDLFLPLAQSKKSLFFGDFRGVVASNSTEEGNFGMGLRRIIPGKNFGLGSLIAGGYTFYDVRSSENDFTYHQATLGFELLGNRWDFRANGYIPFGDTSNILSSRNVARFSGPETAPLSLSGTSVLAGNFTRNDTVTMMVARERALSGFDMEGGYKFDLTRRQSLWLYGGFFQFNNVEGLPDINGPRLRAEYRLEDVFRVRGARLTLGAEWQDDDVRGSQGAGMIRIRVPLEKLLPGRRSRRTYRDIRSRMNATIIRDIDVVTHAQDLDAAADSPDAPEMEEEIVPTTIQGGVATDPATGQPLNVYFVTENGAGDCTQNNPCSVARAQSDGNYGSGDVLVLRSSNGNIKENILLTQPRQQVVGGGNTGTAGIQFSNGSQLNLSNLGSRPTLAPATGTALTMSDGSTAKGFTIHSGATGVLVNDVTGTMNDVVVMGGTVGISVQGSGNLVATSTTVQNNASTAIQLLNHNGFVSFDGMVLNPLGSAIQVDGGSGMLAFGGNVTQNNNAALLEVLNGHSGSAQFSNGTLSGSNGSGLSFNNADGSYTFAGTTTLFGGLAGVDITNGSTGTFNFGTNTSISERTAAAFNLDGGTPTVTYSGTINNAVNDAIAIANTTGGSVNFNSALANAINDTGSGVFLNSNAGSVSIRNALLQGSEGIDINAGSGNYFFTDTKILHTTGTPVDIAGGTSTLTFEGTISQANNTALVNVSGGHAAGTVMFRNGTLSASNGTGLQFDNADGTYHFAGTTTLNGGDAGIDILNGSAGTFNFGPATSITSPTGSAFNLAGGTASVTYKGNITQTGNNALVSVSGGHSTGKVVFKLGTLSATNGTGLQFDNADSTYQFDGATTLNGGDAGIDILNGSGGAFTFGSGTTITNPTGVAVNIAGGTSSVTFSGNITQIGNVATVNVSGGHSAGTVRFDTGTINVSNGTGLQFDSANGTYQFEGVTNLNGGDAGVDILNGSTGTFTFGSGASIINPTGTAFNVAGGSSSVTYSGNITQTGNVATVNIAGGHSGGTIRFDSGTINVTNGTGLQFDNADGTYQFEGTTSLNGGDSGIDILNGSGGTFTFGTGTTITNPTGTAFNIAGGTANVTFDGNISQTNASRLVNIDGMTGGSVIFQIGKLTGGAASTGVLINNSASNVTFSDLDLGSSAGRMTNQAVNLSGANTGTFTFSSLNIFTNGATGFGANNGGTVNITGAGNTIDTTLGTGLSLINTTIGTSGLTFESINASNTLGQGITLDTTGGLGGLTITGTGTAGSGGTLSGFATGLFANSILRVDVADMNIGGSTADGVNIATANTVNLSGLNITNSATDGVLLNTVNSVTLNNLSIANAGDDAFDFDGNFTSISGVGSSLTAPIGTSCETAGATITNNTLTFTNAGGTPNSTCP